MKTYVLTVAIHLFVTMSISAEIKNGYSTEIQGVRQSLKTINTLLQEDQSLTLSQRMSMRAKAKELKNYITCYLLTERLLEQFKLISPDLYDEVDTLKSRTGKNPDVYVKFVPENALPSGVAGITNVAQVMNDPHAYFSEYGPNTVSIIIAACRKSLWLLAHEFGHVKYQAAHLAAYVDYFKRTYMKYDSKTKSIGHNDNDESGRQARQIVKRFHRNYLDFLKSTKRRLETRMVISHNIKKCH